MKNIPVRQIKATPKEANCADGFSIRDVRDLLAGKDMVQELHRHDFYYILALKKGAGHHEIDFTRYEVCNHAVFFMRPGQVHQQSEAGGFGVQVVRLRFRGSLSMAHRPESWGNLWSECG